MSSIHALYKAQYNNVELMLIAVYKIESLGVGSFLRLTMNLTIRRSPLQLHASASH